jgi:flagellum-specific ATP synthase
MTSPLHDAPSAVRWRRRLQQCQRRAEHPPPLIVEGKLTRMVGLTLEAVGCQVAIGGQCTVHGPGGSVIEAEAVGFSGDKTFLMPTGDIRGLTPNARVIPSGRVCEAVVGNGLLGRVIDGRGMPLDGKGRLMESSRMPLTGRPINPMHRGRIVQPLDVGIRSINSLFTVGRGQRMGLFAGSGVGKSVLLGMMTRFTSADVTVVGLIGERGREVKEFIENILGHQGMQRAVVVATPANDPPLLRLHGAMLATSIAEYFRDQGKQVLLLMDSLTRFAQAQREIALAVGEPPATKGYPPSVFARLPELVERTGNGDRNGGSITAFYTVLTEEDEQYDPIGDAARAILDGHVVLSRELAEAGIYPAIDVEASISRAMQQITKEDHQKHVQRFRHLYAKYRQNRDLISVGAYQPGNDAHLDEAVEYHPRLLEYLQQGMNQPIDIKQSNKALQTLLGAGP